MVLFDQVIGAKKNRGRQSYFGKASTSFLADVSDHLWRSAAATPPSSKFPGDYGSVVSRSMFTTIFACQIDNYMLIIFHIVPAKLDPSLMKEPRVIHGIPRISTAKARRKPIPSMLGPGGPLSSSPPV